MKNIFALLAASILTLTCLFFPGCGNSADRIFRYPHIVIPDYEAKDYYRFLYDDDATLVYNAVCNLIDEASSIAKTLSDRKSDTKSPHFVLASLTYRRVVELLGSKDDRIVAACLRFLQFFAPDYKRKEELTAPVLKVARTGTNVRYEQILTLSAIASEKTLISDAFLKSALFDPSWLVSRAAYSLAGSLPNIATQRILISRYMASDVEYEKLLILAALRRALSADVFAFLSREALETKNERIRRQILGMLGNTVDTAAVLRWVSSNHDRLSPDDIALMAGSHDFTDDFSAALYGVYIQGGWAPDDDFFEELYGIVAGVRDDTETSKLSKEEMKRVQNAYGLEKIVSDSVTAGDRWRRYRTDRDAVAKTAYGEAKDAYRAAMKQYAERLNAIIGARILSPDDRNSFIVSVTPDFVDEKTFNKKATLMRLLADTQ